MDCEFKSICAFAFNAVITTIKYYRIICRSQVNELGDFKRLQGDVSLGEPAEIIKTRLQAQSPCEQIRCAGNYARKV
jgi:hypothetical protein